MKKFLSMIMVIIMVFALAIPALATNHTLEYWTAYTERACKTYESTSTGSKVVNSLPIDYYIGVKFNAGRCDWASCSLGGYISTKDIYSSYDNLGRAMFGTKTLVKDDTGMPIRNVKGALNKLMGATMNTENNTFTATLQQNVKVYQDTRGLSVDGKIGAATKTAMLREMADRWPSYFHCVN